MGSGPQGITGGVRAAKQGHQVIMTPTSHCYFDYRQSLRRAAGRTEPSSRCRAAAAAGGWHLQDVCACRRCCCLPAAAGSGGGLRARAPSGSGSARPGRRTDCLRLCPLCHGPTRVQVGRAGGLVRDAAAGDGVRVRPDPARAGDDGHAHVPLLHVGHAGAPHPAPTARRGRPARQLCVAADVRTAAGGTPRRH